MFSETDRHAFGKEIGLAVAKEQAEQQAAELHKLAAAAGRAEAAAPTIETHVVPKITLYASSDRGLVHALNGETGQTLWTAQVGNPQYPTTAPAANDKYVALCNGSMIYVLQAKDGALAWTRPASGIPGAGAALTEEYVFIPMVSGQIETLLLEDPKRPVAVHKSFGRAMIQPVVSSNSVAWPTDSGNLYVALAHSPGIRFRMQAAETIAAAPAFLAPDKVFTASLDGYLYCVNEEKGNILWRFTTGEPITHSPVTFGETVFAISKRGNMFAIDAQSAGERWVASGIRSYLAASAKRLYCLDLQGNLAILDQATGSRLGTVVGMTGDMPLMNSQTDRIMLISSTGLVQCLREAELPWPVVHYLIEKPTKQARPAPKTGAPKTDDKSAPPKATDPFGSGADTPATSPPPAAADPFAAPGAAKPAPPPDPFGPR